MKPTLKTDVTALVAIGFGTLASLGVGAALMEGRHEHRIERVSVGGHTACAAAGYEEAIADFGAAGGDLHANDIHIQLDESDLAELDAHDEAALEKLEAFERHIEIGNGEITVHRGPNEVRIGHLDNVGGTAHVHCITSEGVDRRVEVRVSGEEMDARRRRPRRVEVIRGEAAEEVLVRAKGDAPRVEVGAAPRR